MSWRFAALAALAACAAPGVEEREGQAPRDPATAQSPLGYYCAGNGDDVCGCSEYCADGPDGSGYCVAGSYRGDFAQCGAIASGCFAGICCQEMRFCAEDGKACTIAACESDGATCKQVEYCPPRNACDSGNGKCGAGDQCDYALVYKGDGQSCGGSLWCFGGLCRPGCFIAGQYYEPGAVRAGNPCQRCAPSASRTSWAEFADGTACGEGKVCHVAACVEGCFIGGALRELGEKNADNACQACASASPTGWTNTTAVCADDGDPCTLDRCRGDGTCGHTLDSTACPPMKATAVGGESMFGCSSAGGGSGAFCGLLLAGVLLALRPWRRAAAGLGVLLVLLPSLAHAAPAAPAKPAAEGVAIFTFRAGPPVSERTAAFVTQAFSAALHARGVETLSQDDVKAALGFDRQRQLVGCASDNCFAEIGGALGVRQLVTGSLGRLGDSLLLNAQVVDTRSAAVEQRHGVRLPATRGDEAFLEAIPELVEALFPSAAAEPTRTFAVGLSGWGELSADAGGAGLLWARFGLLPSLRASAGLLVAPRRVGASARLDWLPWNASGRVYPVVALQGLALQADPLSPGLALDLGVEWRVTPRLDLALEVPVVQLASVPAEMRHTYVFAAASAAWRL